MNRRAATYRARLDACGANWSTHHDHEVVDHYGDPQAELDAARDSALLIADRSERDVLVIEGDDAATWLQGLVTGDVYALRREGSGQRTHAVNRVGRAIADARALHIPDALVLDLEPGVLAGDLLKHLKGHLIMERVRLRDRSAQTAEIALFGPGALATVARLGGYAHPVGRLDGLDGTWGQLGDVDVVVQRLEWTGQEGVSIRCDRDDATTVWDLLVEGAGARPIGHRALEVLRQEAGIPRFGVEYDEKVIPLEADLNHTISYDKGCYLGQEVIHRLDTRGTPAKMLRALTLGPDAVPGEGAQALAGAKVLLGEKAVGEVAHVQVAPRIGGVVLAGYLKRGAYDEGQRVVIAGPDDLRIEATVEALATPLRRHLSRAASPLAITPPSN